MKLPYPAPDAPCDAIQIHQLIGHHQFITTTIPTNLTDYQGVIGS
jgi:hypothetical protein